MKSVDRLVRTRKSQRDVAAEELLNARRRLDATTDQKNEIEKEQNDKLGRAVGNDSLSIQDLERMDIANKSIRKTESHCQEDVDTAKRVAMDRHQKLRQMEIWREKIEARQLKERRLRERKEVDEFAMRRAKKVAPLLIALSLIVAPACKDEAKKKAKAAAKVEKKKKAGPKAAAKTADGKKAKAGSQIPAKGVGKDAACADKNKECAENQVSGAELILLKKLRARSKDIDRREADLKSKEAELKRLKKSAVLALAQLKDRQDILLGKTPGASSKMPKVVILASVDDTAEKKRKEEEAASLAAKKKTDLENAAKDKAKRESEEKAKKEAFLKLVRGFSPRKAAAMMAEMAADKAAGVLISMTPDEQSKILAQVPPAEAAAILQQIQALEEKKVVKKEKGK
jgi:flagellar biosynthesis chaperone FliJ